MASNQTIAIIGAGASGMIAGCVASMASNTKVLLFEKQNRVGRKISVTGNGRCNLSNSAVALSTYHGKKPDFVSHCLSSFDVNQTLDFFSSLGLLTFEEPSGRIYPYSDSANSVVDVLRFSLMRPNVDIYLEARVEKIRKVGDVFHIYYNKQTISADKVIVACGGIAGGKIGGTTDGYELLQSFGHTLVPLHPALVQLKSNNPLNKSLKGVRTEANISLFDSKKMICSISGEIQFTDYGLSGPAIFDISRAVSECSKPEIHLDLFPSLATDSLINFLHQRVSSLPSLTLSDLFTGMLHNRLGRVIVQYCGYNINTPLSNITDEDIRKIVNGAKCFVHSITGDLGFDNAQVTAGGILTDEFDPCTLESRLVPGLYATGEVLDIDGDCGGFNLQWAWSSGYVAGKAASIC